MDLSYAQNLEDYHLWLALGERTSGTYIDVGGGHPIADNVSFWFYERGWRGIIVEPQAELARLYGRLRPRDLVVQGLLGSEEGTAEFYEVDRFHGLSTMVAENAQRASELGTQYRKVRLPITTLARMCESNNLTDIDFLKIDVEGAEASVLKGGDWRRFRPKVIVVEAIAPNSGEPNWAEWESPLLSQDYEFVLFDTLNRFYVAKECADVLARVPRQRADWHAVRHMYEIGRAPENSLHPDHKLAKDLIAGFLAGLPDLDDAALKTLLERSQHAVGDLKDERFRFSLGRIACGYDGGQIIDDAVAAKDTK
jgi:FkbM family methyltransferase